MKINFMSSYSWYISNSRPAKTWKEKETLNINMPLFILNLFNNTLNNHVPPPPKSERNIYLLTLFFHEIAANLYKIRPEALADFSLS